MSSSIIIDVQGFKDDENRFILKELAVSYNFREYQHFLLKPPCEFSQLTKNEQKQVNWLYRNYHGLKWDDGSITFKSIQKFLLRNLRNKNVYVKGYEKS